MSAERHCRFPPSGAEMIKRLASLQSVIFLSKKTQFTQANKLAHYKPESDKLKSQTAEETNFYLSHSTGDPRRKW